MSRIGRITRIARVRHTGFGIGRNQVQCSYRGAVIVRDLVMGTCFHRGTAFLRLCPCDQAMTSARSAPEVRCTLTNSHRGDMIVLLIYSCPFHTPPASFRRCSMRATVRAVLLVFLVLSPFSSTAMTPKSSLAPAVEAAHTSHSDSDPTELWPSSYLLAASPGVLPTAPGRLSAEEHEHRFGGISEDRRAPAALAQLWLESRVHPRFTAQHGHHPDAPPH